MSWLVNITDYSNATADFFFLCKGQEGGLIFWTCVIVVAFVFGFPGTFVVLLDMIQKRRKGIPFSPNDVFMLNLAVMDGIYLFFLLPELYNYLLGHNFAFNVFSTFLVSFNVCGRPLFLTCICLDCYIAVVHPVTYRVRKSLTPRVLMSVGVWTVTGAHGCYFTSRDVNILIDLNPILFFILTLPVIGFCDFSILWTLKRSNPGGGEVHPQKKKALQIVINNLVITFISYLPPIITVFVSHFLSLDEITIHCLVVIPVMSITTVGNIALPILHLQNLGKLDCLKFWKQK